MKNKHKKIEKTSLTRSAAYSKERLGDWKHCLNKAFHNDTLNEHYRTLNDVAYSYGEGFYYWIQCDILKVTGYFCPYKYNWRTTIFK